MSYEIDQFRDAIRAAGMTPPQVIELGRFHRFPGAGKRNGNTAGWCKLFPDGMGGTFGDYSSGFSQQWQARRERPLTFAEHAGFHELVERARVEAEAARREEQAQAASRAAAIWHAAPALDTSHPYLVRKSVKPHGLRLHKGALVVPMRDAAGELHSLQFIGEDGSKRYLSDGRTSGCYFSIGKPDGVLCIAEGYATAATIHEATGHAVAVTFSAGNLAPVALALRASLPNVRIIVCADDDYRTAGNPGMAKAIEAARAVGGLLAVPDFGADRPEGATDFNDLAMHQGCEAVERAIANAFAPDVPEGQPPASNAIAGDLTGREWPKPQPIRAALHPVPSFDPDALLPPVLRDWVMDEAERMPCAPDFVGVAAVVAVGATIGARCAIKPKARDSWQVVPNLWGGIVALPSAKKSPAIGAAMAPVDRLSQAQHAHREELEAFETDRVVAEARRDAIKDAIKSEARKGDGGSVEAKAEELRRHKLEAPQPPTLRRYRTNDATVGKLGELLRDNPAGLLVEVVPQSRTVA